MIANTKCINDGANGHADKQPQPVISNPAMKNRIETIANRQRDAPHTTDFNDQGEKRIFKSR